MNTSTTPLGTGVQNPNVVYDPAKVWATGDAGQYAASNPNAYTATPNSTPDGARAQSGNASGFTKKGASDINDTVSLSVGSSIIYTVHGTIDKNATGADGT